MWPETMPPCYYKVRSEVIRLGLNAITATAKTIRETFGVRTELPRDFKLRIETEPSLTHLPPCQLARTRGGYDPFRKEIRLIGSAWCWKTLVHEVLHALSAFHRHEHLARLSVREWRGVVEGLTEFLTGYVLYQARDKRNCYKYWLEKTYTPCQISYEPYVRVFAALTQTLVPLHALTKLFFYDKTKPWEQTYAEFLRTYRLPDLLRQPDAYQLEDAITRTLRETGRNTTAETFETLIEDDLRELLDYSKTKP